VQKHLVGPFQIIDFRFQMNLSNVDFTSSSGALVGALVRSSKQLVPCMVRHSRFGCQLHEFHQIDLRGVTGPGHPPPYSSPLPGQFRARALQQHPRARGPLPYTQSQGGLLKAFCETEMPLSSNSGDAQDAKRTLYRDAAALLGLADVVLGFREPMQIVELGGEGSDHPHHPTSSDMHRALKTAKTLVRNGRRSKHSKRAWDRGARHGLDLSLHSTIHAAGSARGNRFHTK